MADSHTSRRAAAPPALVARSSSEGLPPKDPQRAKRSFSRPTFFCSSTRPSTRHQSPGTITRLILRERPPRNRSAVIVQELARFLAPDSMISRFFVRSQSVRRRGPTSTLVPPLTRTGHLRTSLCSLLSALRFISSSLRLFSKNDTPALKRMERGCVVDRPWSCGPSLACTQTASPGRLLPAGRIRPRRGKSCSSSCASRSSAWPSCAWSCA